MIIRGTDVSSNQFAHRMRFAQWSVDPGLAYGYYRLTWGTWTDPEAAAHRANMRAAGMKTGAYGVITEFTPPAAQAQYFIDRVPADDECPDWLDAERPAVTEPMLSAWCDHYDQHSRRRLVIYTRKPWWENHVPPHRRPRYAVYGLAIAAYPFDAPSDRPQPMDPASVALRSNPPVNRLPQIPQPWDSFEFWQHTGHGRLSGYDADLDLSIWKIPAPPVPPSGSDITAMAAEIQMIAAQIAGSA